MNLGLQQKKIIEIFKREQKNVDWDKLIDQSLLDKSLHFQENLNNLAEQFHINLDEFDEDLVEHYNNQKIQHEQEHYNKIFKKELKKIVKETPGVDKYYVKLHGYLNTLLNSDTSGLIVLGDTGLGKSYQITKYLEKNKANWESITTFASPLELYSKLYEGKDKQVILLDDVIRVLDNDVSKGILLTSLWGMGGKRFVEYNTTSGKLKVPSRFELKAKIILICNELPAKMDNVLSRVLFYDLSFNYKERIKLIYEIGRLNNIPIEILKFIEQNTSESTRPEYLNLRTPLKFHSIYKTNPDDWKSLCLEQLKIDEDLQIIYKLLQQDITEKMRVQEFIKLTGKSRASYFRYKAKVSKSHQIKNIK